MVLEMAKVLANTNRTYQQQGNKKIRRVVRQWRRVKAKKLPTVEVDPKVQELPDENATEVLGVLATLAEARKNRQKAEIENQMKEIHHRVVLALTHYGMAGTIEVTPSEMGSLNSSILGSGFSAESKKQELEHKRGFIEMITAFFYESGQRKAILHEIIDWLESSQITELPTDDDFDNAQEFLRVNSEAVNGAFEHTFQATEKIRELGDKLLKEAGFTDSGDEEDSCSSEEKPPKRRVQVVEPIKHVLDDTQLLANPGNLSMALDDVKVTLDQGIRMVRTNQQKTTFRNALKQHRFMIKALGQRFEESAEKDQTIAKLDVDMNALKNAKARLQEEVAKLERKVDKLDAVVSTSTVKLATLEKEKKSLRKLLNNVMEEKEDAVTAVGVANAAAAEAAAALPAARSIQHSAVSIVSLTEQSSTSQLQEAELITLKTELGDLQGMLEIEQARVTHLETALQEEQHRAVQLESEIEKTKEIEKEEKAPTKKKLGKMSKGNMRTLHSESDSIERQVERLLAELVIKNELIEHQEQSLRNMREELSLLGDDVHEKDDQKKEGKVKKKDEVKKMVVRMRRECEDEVNRLKTHVEKEKQRYEADLRRLEQGHQEQLQNVHKQSIHLLRAINRFKGSVAVILERENLTAAANDVRLMPDLPIDNAPSDTRLLLAQIAGSAVELLVSIEFKLSQSLMNKRLEVKDKAFAEVFANKDLELQVNASTRAKQTAHTLQEKLSETKDKLRHSENAIIELRKRQDKRCDDLMFRNTRLMDNYKTIQKQMSTMQATLGESLKRREKQLKTAMSQRVKLTRTVEEQQTMIQSMQTELKQRLSEADKNYKLSLTDQAANLKILESALSDGLITRDMHDMTVGVINQFKALPLLRLRVLVERYVAFRKLQDAKDQLKDQWSDSLLSDRKDELDIYLTRIDNQHQSASREWQAKQDELEAQREQLFSQMSDIFDDMVGTAILLNTQPQLKMPEDEPGSVQTVSPEPVLPGRNLTKPFIRRQSTLPPITTPPKVVGTNMTISGSPEPMWKLPELPEVSGSGGYGRKSTSQVPRLLEMEVNQPIRRAHRQLKLIRRAPLEMATVEGYDYEDCIVRSLQELLSRDLSPERPLTLNGDKKGFINPACRCRSVCSGNCSNEAL